MEEQKTREITVEVFGREKWLDGDNECRSFFSLDEKCPQLEFTVEGKTYGPSDFGSEADLISPEESSEYKDLDVERFYTDETNDDKVLLWSQKTSSSITIDIPVGEDFDPSKAAIIGRLYKYPFHTGLGCERVMMAFVYDGKIYDCLPEDSNGGSSMVIWKRKGFDLADKTKKITVCISSAAGAKELSCGDYANFYIQSICEPVSLYVEDDAGNIIYEDEEFDLCPGYSIGNYSEALNPEDEDEENEDCVDNYRNTKFKAADFFKKAWDKLPLLEPISSDPDFVRNLIKEAVEGDDEVEMKLSSGEDEDQPLVVRFEIEVSDGIFDIDKLDFINFDITEDEWECADIINNAFAGWDSVLLNLLKYGDTFYQNSEGGFIEGCNIDDTATVNGETLEEC